MTETMTGTGQTDQSDGGFVAPGSPTREENGFVAYEYTTIRADRDLEALYKDTFHNFGWVIEDQGPNLPSATTVTLKLKRDRRIKNRPMILELQRKCENALASISRMQRSQGAAAMTSSLVVGIIGTAFLAGSVFSIEAGLIWLSIVLGGIGLVGWAMGYLVHGRVKAKKTEQLSELIDRQYEVVYETAEQANRLLA